MAVQPARNEGFRAIVSESLEDPISLEPLLHAVTVVPCGHVFNETTVVRLLAGNSPCPLDKQPIERYISNFMVRHLAGVVESGAEEERAPSPNPEAREHFARGKELLEKRNLEEAISAFLMALQITPTFEKAQRFLEFALSLSIENSSAADATSEELYNDLLFRLIDHPNIQADPELRSILERQIEQLMEGGRLSPRGERSESWARRLLSEGNDVRQFVADKLKEIHGSPTSPQPTPDIAMAGDSLDVDQDMSPEELARISPNTTNLHIRHKSISNAMFLAIIERCPQLSSLNVEGCKQLTDAAMIAVAQACTQLSSLNVWGCNELTDAAIIAVAQACPLLSSLNVQRCFRLTDAAIIAVAQECPQLSSLDVRLCSRLTDAAMIAVAQECPQLSSLNVSSCELLTDAAMIAVAQACTQLSSLNVSWCKLLTDAAIIAVAQACTQLSSLNVLGCEQLTDAAIIAVAQACTQLSSLNVWECNQLTDAAIIAVAQACTLLSFLDVEGCEQLTDAAINVVKGLGRR